jgi:quercetin dioxygenase-like cupin family protein
MATCHISRGDLVRYRFVPQVIAVAFVSASLLVCAGNAAPRANSAQRAPARGAGLVLQEGEGERRVRRNVGKGPFILKIDRQNGGSPDLVMGYEDLAPGAEIQPHTHLVADEILFVHRGTGVAKLGQQESPVRAGATIYIPRNVQISVRNTGSEPLGIAFIFSKPGFEELMRDNSVLEGQPVTPISAEEREQIRKRHSWHTVFPP